MYHSMSVSQAAGWVHADPEEAQPSVEVVICRRDVRAELGDGKGGQRGLGGQPASLRGLQAAAGGGGAL
jgi:hypothetical protein